MTETGILNINILLQQIVDAFLHYSRMGWSNLKKQYGEKGLVQIEWVLKLFGMLRIMLVDNLFNHCQSIHDKEKTCSKIAVGSTNIKSDYDITISGKNAPEVVMCMIETFYSQNKTMMSIMFDTNLYCVGMYDKNGIRQDLINEKKVLIFGDQAIVYPVSVSEYTMCLAFALLRLAPVLQQYLPPDLNYLHDLVVKYQNELQRQCQAGNQRFQQLRKTAQQKTTTQSSKTTAQQKKPAQSSNQTKNPSQQGTPTQSRDQKIQQVKPRQQQGKTQTQSLRMKAIFRSYQLQTINAKMVNEILYGFGVALRLMEYVCISMFYAIESYYTPMTVLVVVLFLQGKKFSQQQAKTKIPPFCFLCCVLENLGFFYEHITPDLLTKTNTDLAPFFLDVSKYLNRIWISMYYLTKDASFQARARRIQADVVSKRGSSPSAVPFSDLAQIISYKQNDTLQTFTDTLCREIFDSTIPFIRQHVSAPSA